MKTIKYISYIFIIALFSFTVQSIGTLSVVSNSDNGETEMTFAQMKKYIKGEKTKFSNGTKIKLALMKGSTPEGKLVAEKIFGTSGTDMDKHFLKLTFQGKIAAPKMCSNKADLINYVKSTPGAIGVIFSEGAPSDIVVKIDGNTSF